MDTSDELLESQLTVADPSRTVNMTVGLFLIFGVVALVVAYRITDRQRAATLADLHKKAQEAVQSAYTAGAYKYPSCEEQLERANKQVQHADEEIIRGDNGVAASDYDSSIKLATQVLATVAAFPADERRRLDSSYESRQFVLRESQRQRESKREQAMRDHIAGDAASAHEEVQGMIRRGDITQEQINYMRQHPNGP